MSLETRNARITATSLGLEDHRILSCYLTLDYGGAGQSFGGYSLDGFNKDMDKRIGTAFGMEFVRRILEVLEVDSWEKLNGVYCRAMCEHSKIHAIGHVLKDQWFDPETDLVLGTCKNLAVPA